MLLARFFAWMISDGRSAPKKPVATCLDARAVACKTGEKVGGLTEWRVTLQVRHPTSDFDGVYSINWASHSPPDVSELMHHMHRSPQDFRFVNFLPTVKNVQACA